MPSVPFSSIEVTSVVFLIIFTILIIPSIYVWIQYIRAGYHWRYGFWGAFLICASRIACFVSELVFYSSSYRNRNAVIAFVVTLSIGFIGLLECESALWVSWAETHIGLSTTLQQVSGKIRLLNIVGIILVIVGSTKTDSQGMTTSEGSTYVQAGTIIFLVLTFLQSLFVGYGWIKSPKLSPTLGILTVVVAALYVRIIWGVYSSFHHEVSIITFQTSDVKYLIGATLVPEVVALVLMIILGIYNVRVAGLPNKRNPEGQQEAYSFDRLEAQKAQQRHDG